MIYKTCLINEHIQFIYLLLLLLFLLVSLLTHLYMPIINRKGFKGNIKRKKGRMRKGKKTRNEKGTAKNRKTIPSNF